MNQLVDIYSFTDYRKFLLAHYEARKKLNPFFSYRYIAAKANLSATTFSRILSGGRNISQKLATNLALALKLGKKESEYFQLLILFEQAETHSEKKLYFEKLLAHPGGLVTVKVTVFPPGRA